jgi:mxaJ protein
MRGQFNKGVCDVLMGVPEHLEIASFSDPSLDHRRIGLQILEEDLSPPSIPLIRDGHAGQLIGFESFGKRSGDIVRAVSVGRIGTAVVLGPFAGYFTAVTHLPLLLTPVTPAVDSSGIPFTFALTVGVHKQDLALRDAIDQSLVHLQPQIDKLLAEYHVPVLALAEGVR